MGKVPDYHGRGRPPILPIPDKDWKYLQIIKTRTGSKLLSVISKVIYGNEKEVKEMLGEHTAYVERTHLTGADR